MSEEGKSFKAPNPWKLSIIKTVFGRLNDRLKEVPEPFNKMSAFAVLVDFAWCTLIYGVNLNDYFAFKFYKFNHRGRKSFISSHRGYAKLIKASNKQSNFELLENKVLFAEKFSDLMKRDIFSFTKESSKDEYDQFINRLYKSGTERFIFKPSSGYRGSGIFTFGFDEADKKFDEIKKSLDNDTWGTGVIEPIIVNEETIRKIHPQSLNTLRIPTYTDNDGNISIIGAYLRIGRGDSFVDNFAAGGIVTEIDVESGISATLGIDKHAEEHILHPDTKEQIVGIQMPYWDEVKELVLSGAKRFPELHYLSWDVAITPTGPVIIECNFGGDTDIQQIPKDAGLKHKYKGVF